MLIVDCEYRKCILFLFILKGTYYAFCDFLLFIYCYDDVSYDLEKGWEEKQLEDHESQPSDRRWHKWLLGWYDVAYLCKTWSKFQNLRFAYVEMLPASQTPGLQPALKALFATYFSTLPTSWCRLVIRSIAFIAKVVFFVCCSHCPLSYFGSDFGSNMYGCIWEVDILSKEWEKVVSEKSYYYTLLHDLLM